MLEPDATPPDAEAASVSPPPVAAARCGVHPERVSVLVCDRCGTFACAECARSAGASGICAACEERVGVVPWERRAEPGMGYARALWQTLRDSIVRPRQLFSQRYRDASAMPSIGYGLLIALPVAALNVVYQLFGVDLQSLVERFAPSPGPADDGGWRTAGTVCAFVFSPLLYALGLAIKAGVWHLALRAMGVGKGAFDRTFRTFAYTEATAILSVVPVVGQLAALCVGAVYACIALTAAHETEWWRVVIAGIVVFALLCTLCFGCFALLFFGAVASAPGVL